MDELSATGNTTPRNGVPPIDGQEPKRYIRTFAGDVEMAEKGKISPPNGQPNTVQVPQPSTQPPSPPRAPQPAVPPPALEVPEKSPPPPSPGKRPVPLQTYASDFSDRLEITHASAATVLAAEQDALPPPPQVPPPEPSRISLSYVAVGTALVAVSVGSIYLAYMRFANVAQPVTPIPNIPAPILVDEREEVSGAGSSLVRAITASVARPLPIGAVRLLSVASSSSAANAFSLLPLSAPDTLLRNIQTKGSMTGIINASGNQSPFFILSVSAYSNVFSALLAWEPLMPVYLADLFPPFAGSFGESATSSTAIVTTTIPATAATTTLENAPETATTSPPLAPPADGAFVDETVANHDVRVYRDAAGRDLFLYGFWNQATLIIARNAAAFAEIVGRLATSRAP